jgi:flagellar biosynthesis protein FlhG
MSESGYFEDFACLGLDPSAALPQVKQAYQRLKTLYGRDTLATYSLLNEHERSEKLNQIETAYDHISHQLGVSAPQEAETPDLPDTPGRLLRHVRERAGITLKEIAQRTKIGTMKLEYIETERFEYLPAPVYLRGFVTQYAQLLGLPDPEAISHRYLELYRQKA